MGWTFGVAPYGKMRNPANKGQLIDNPEENGLINEMCRLYDNSSGSTQTYKENVIYNQLQHQQMRNRKVNKIMIRRILTKTGRYYPKPRHMKTKQQSRKQSKKLLSKKPFKKRCLYKSGKNYDSVNALSGCVQQMNVSSNYDDIQYEVEEILGMKIIKKNNKKLRYYHIKWKGYPESDNSWEPEENLNQKAIHSIGMDSSDEEDNECELDDILGMKIVKENGKKVKYYQIKWTEYDATWEPEENLNQEALCEFGYA